MRKWLVQLGLALGAAVMFMMAEIERNPQQTVAAGSVPTVLEGLNAADTQLINGNQNGNIILRVTNGGAEATKVTVVTPGTVGGNPVGDLENEIANGATEVMGPFDPNVYNNSKGQLEVKLTKTTSVKIEIFKVSF